MTRQSTRNRNRTATNFLTKTIYLLFVILAAATLSACSEDGASGENSPSDAGADALAEDAALSDSDFADGDLDAGVDADAAPASVENVRVATFNVSLFRYSSEELAEDLAGGDDPKAREVAEVLQRVRPDVVLLNEFDWDANGEAAQTFVEEYLGVSQGGAEPIEYAFHYVPATNTGVSSGIDLNNSGRAVTTPGSQAYGDDSFGFGEFPGQYGMLVLSRYPIRAEQARSFQTFLWRDMPQSLQPTDWYSAVAVEIMRLSSKNHVDLPVQIGESTLHLLVSHPTPPSFDGPEDRNGRRNHDEIRFWVDYISDAARSGYIYDDEGGQGGLGEESFVILGDLNSDPADGNSRPEALVDLLDHPRVQDPQPTSAGASEAASSEGQINSTHQGDPGLDTADFPDRNVGNLRVDYALPSADLNVTGQGVFWPAPDAKHAGLADVSDHHLVWVDIEVAYAH
jgi:endonuclease/exonuclease/phosphatase family metal-dependent hydrolase